MKTTIFALDSAQVPTVCEINVTAPMKARTKQTSTVEQEIQALWSKRLLRPRNSFLFRRWPSAYFDEPEEQDHRSYQVLST
jgi:hypothetical protein